MTCPNRLQANNETCATCSLKHKTIEGRTADLYFHLVYSHSWHLQRFSFWLKKWMTIVMAVAAFNLAVIPVAVRIARQGAFAGKARDEDEPTRYVSDTGDK